MKSIRWRSFVVAGLTLLSIYLLIPTYFYMSQPAELRNDHEHMKKVMPGGLPNVRLNLGLDLQGGVQLVLGVDLEQAVENRLGRIGTELTHWIKDKGIPFKTAYVVKGKNFLRVELGEGADPDKFKEEFRKQFVGLEIAKRENLVIDYQFRSEQIASIKSSALEQAERVVRSRVDKWGVTEPSINRRADGSIIAQLPGFKDPEKAKELLGRTAQLKFKIVDDEFRGFDAIARTLPAGVTSTSADGSVSLVSESREQIVELTKGLIPPDRELVFGREAIAGGTKARYTSYVVKAATDIGGDDILDANVTMDQSQFDNRPAVSLKFTAVGSKRFEDVTAANVRKRMAILLDDQVESAPVINQKIGGGNAIITLGSGRNYDEIMTEANQLTLVLKSGALPATITIMEQRLVGASLGPELTQRGMYGVVMGLILVFLFMMIYYRRPGLIACVALVLNGIFLIAMMASFGFALTLPGIAGFVLSLGMAVDANVLINERIRQELRDGKQFKKALDLGFEKVFWTVIDGHVTTLLAGVILLNTNASGPIRGFAVALVIGLVLSMFTALYCSRLFFDIVLSRNSDPKAQKAWLGGDWALKKHDFHFNFLRWDSLATGLAVLLSLGVVIGSAVKGLHWSVDFVGGTEVEVQFAESVQVDQIREVGTKAGIKELIVQSLKGSDKNYLLRFEEGAGKGSDVEGGADPTGGVKVQKFNSLLLTDLASAKPDVLRVDFVGPQIGREMRNQGFVSVFYVLLGIMLYLAFRFDMRFGTAAVLKLIPDACAMLGFYLVFWRSFDLTSVAALLTGIGYSVNDVIVVFDRIRENLQLHPRRSFAENINISINESLSRTINTSLVTNLSIVGIIFFGPDTIRNFAIAMSAGIISATFTTSFVGSGYLLWFDKHWKKRKMASAMSGGSAVGAPAGSPRGTVPVK